MAISRPKIDLNRVIQAIDRNCRYPGHKSALKATACVAASLGCDLHLEPQMQNARINVSYNNELIFTIRSTRNGLWAEFFDPQNSLRIPNYCNHITPIRQTRGQYNKYAFNKTAPFGEETVVQACVLLEACLERLRATQAKTTKKAPVKKKAAAKTKVAARKNAPAKKKTAAKRTTRSRKTKR